jgi:polyisoprenoid-binding protein YceI
MLIRTGVVAAALLAGAFVVSVFAPQAHSRAVPQANAWTVDSVHSSVIFRIKHLDAAWFYGRFDHLSGTINYDEAEPSASTLNLEVKTESVNSGNARRDGHLKSPDFFNAKQFPVSTFVSTSFARTGEGVYDIAGDLTINGVTRPVTTRLERTGRAKAQRGEVIGFEAVFNIRRSDFGITYGPDSLSDEVRMIVSIEAKQE